jgi:hypothetical protein
MYIVNIDSSEQFDCDNASNKPIAIGSQYLVTESRAALLQQVEVAARRIKMHSRAF